MNVEESKLVTKRDWIALLSVSVTVLLITVEISAVTIVLPTIAFSLNIPLSETQWIINAYLLTFVFSVVLAGRLGDVFGQRKVAMYGLAIFVVFSFVTGLATSFWFLLCGRVIQGFGASLLAPTSRVLAYHLFPAKKRGVAMGMIASMAALGTAVGPFLGGTLESLFSWRWVFFINVPIGLGCLFVIKFFTKSMHKHPSLEEKKEIFQNVLMASILGLSLLCLVLSFNLIDQLDVYKNLFFLLITIGAACFFIFVFVEKKKKYPLIDFSLFGEKKLVWGYVLRIFLTLVFIGFGIIMSLYLQEGHGYTPFSAGLLFLPMTVITGLFSPVSGKIMDRIGVKIPFSIGLVCLLLALLGFSFVHVHYSFYLLVLSFALMGLGVGFYVPVLTYVIMSCAPKGKVGLVSSLSSLSRILGGAFGAVLVGLLISISTTATDKQTLLIAFPLFLKISFVLILVCFISSLFLFLKKS